MKVKDLMTKEVVTVDKDEDLKHVLNLMDKHNITKIPVMDEKRLIGIVTDSAIAIKLGSVKTREISVSRLHASSVTEKEIEIISPDVDIKSVLLKVGKPGPTILPVVKNEKLVGVLTKADLLPLVKSKEPIQDVMRKKIFTVSPDDRVIHARRIMIDQDIARIPVVHLGRLVGIISDKEIVDAFASLKKLFSLGHQKHRLDELLVKKVMKTPAVWIPSTMCVADAAKVMIKMNVGALPVLKDEELIGIVSRTDILNTIKV